MPPTATTGMSRGALPRIHGHSNLQLTFILERLIYMHTRTYTWLLTFTNMNFHM